MNAQSVLQFLTAPDTEHLYARQLITVKRLLQSCEEQGFTAETLQSVPALLQLLHARIDVSLEAYKEPQAIAFRVHKRWHEQQA